MKKFRIVALLLVMCLASSCFVGGTFAKYASTATGTDTAHIAIWTVDIDGADIVSQSFEINLFDTLKDSNKSDNETNVKSGTSLIIAPGTSGSDTFTVENTSDVTISLSTTHNIGVGYITLNLTDNDDDDELAPGESATYTLSWEWPIGTNGSDNAVGEASATAYNNGTGTRTAITATVTVTATQVD